MSADSRLLSKRALAMALATLATWLASNVLAQTAAPHSRALPDVLQALLPSTYPRPLSVWQSNEKSFYEKLLSKSRFDVLIVPFQSQGRAFDRATRSLMTAQLALAIGMSDKVRVADPYLVARALGDGNRRLLVEDVYALARKLGVKRVVWGYVGHSDGNKLWLTVQHHEWSASGHVTSVPKELHFPQQTFTDEIPPIEVFQELLPQIVEAAGFSPQTGSVRPSKQGAGSKAPMPNTVLAITKEAPDAIRDVRNLLLLAALAPSFAARTSERFAERSLLSLLSVAPQSPGYRYLKARAFMQLGLRKAAIKTLGSPTTNEEHHLLAVLNGNLPEVNRLTPKIEPGVSALLARLDANAIATKYEAIGLTQAEAAAQAMKLPDETWRLFVTRAMTDWSQWAQHDNLALKQLLDKEFPIPGFALEDIARGSLTLGDFSAAERAVAVSILDHVRKLLEIDDALCCAPLALRVTRLDYLDLVESIGTDNLMRRARFIAYMQGAPESALQFITSIEGAYKDHPQLALARAHAEAGLAGRSSGSVSEGYRRSAYLNAMNAMFWEQGQTPTAAEAFDVKAGVGRSYFGYVDNLYATDYPYRPFYPAWAQGGSREAMQRNAQAALNNSSYDLTQLHEMRRWGTVRSTEKFVAVLASLEGRFAGSALVAVMRAEASEVRGDVKTAALHYREAIKAQPGYWDSHLGLGVILFDDGQVAEAAKVFMSYAGFKEGTADPVSLSNHAYGAGSLFFWTGNFAEAAALYKIAADLRTGSDASMTSASRLALVQGNYVAAATGSLERAQRYHSAYAYRDYLGLLHVMGHSKEAWDGFFALVGHLDRPQVWETALVGHRLAGLTEKQLADWSRQERVRNSGGTFAYAAMYLLRAGVVDRMPSSDLASVVAALDRPVWQLEGGGGHVVRPRLDGTSEVVLGPNSPGHPDSSLPLGVFAASKKVRVKSDLVYFAEAYRAIRTGQFASASAGLQEAAKLYDPRNHAVGYLLPYLAFAAAKDGNLEAVEQVLARFPLEHQRFDYYLAKASIAGIAGRLDESLRYLNLALHRRLFTEHRPVFPEYQYAELCEWLFEATRDERYRVLAVDWAKKNQVFQPWFAWPYAVEAKLSSNPEERRKAIATTHYLDKNSERLKAVPDVEIAAALKEFKDRNPFLGVQGGTRRGPI
jgi:tetratricopeptide (TPR) repeat protein